MYESLDNSKDIIRGENEDTKMSKDDYDSLDHRLWGVIESLIENTGRLSQLSVTKNTAFIKSSELAALDFIQYSSCHWRYLE